MNQAKWAYSEKVRDHFMNPRNVLEDEAAFDADGRGVTGSVKCGDEMLVVIKVDHERGVITDCRWQTYGCASAIASTSVLSEMVKGMRLEDAYRLSARDVNRALGGLPEHKVHCSVLGDKALRQAINDYYERHGMPEKIQREEERVVCHCMNVTDVEIEHAVLEGARTFYELQERTKVGTVCGECHSEVKQLLEFYQNKHFAEK
ncbi:MAG: iron-sulfur cluster assembly scaffold protein [Armatimonadetes bacterium]|nr:iron-sulfur cluster assembly scaffold protein [Armatimonadota bacterium]